jgi:hypothetical protein
MSSKIAETWTWPPTDPRYPAYGVPVVYFGAWHPEGYINYACEEPFGLLCWIAEPASGAAGLEGFDWPFRPRYRRPCRIGSTSDCARCLPGLRRLFRPKQRKIRMLVTERLYQDRLVPGGNC